MKIKETTEGIVSISLKDYELLIENKKQLDVIKKGGLFLDTIFVANSNEYYPMLYFDNAICFAEEKLLSLVDKFKELHAKGERLFNKEQALKRKEEYLVRSYSDSDQARRVRQDHEADMYKYKAEIKRLTDKIEIESIGRSRKILIGVVVFLSSIISAMLIYHFY